MRGRGGRSAAGPFEKRETTPRFGNPSLPRHSAHSAAHEDRVRDGLERSDPRRRTWPNSAASPRRGWRGDVQCRRIFRELAFRQGRTAARPSASLPSRRRCGCGGSATVLYDWGRSLPAGVATPSSNANMRALRTGCGRRVGGEAIDGAGRTPAVGGRSGLDRGSSGGRAQSGEPHLSRVQTALVTPAGAARNRLVARHTGPEGNMWARSGQGSRDPLAGAVRGGRRSWAMAASSRPHPFAPCRRPTIAGARGRAVAYPDQARRSFLERASAPEMMARTETRSSGGVLRGGGHRRGKANGIVARSSR